MKFLDVFPNLYTDGEAVTFAGWPEGKVLFMPGKSFVMEYTPETGARPYFRADGAEERHAEDTSEGWAVVPMPAELEGFTIEGWVEQGTPDEVACFMRRTPKAKGSPTQA